MKYADYRRNHAIPRGREQALDAFLNQEHTTLGQHKLKYKTNSTSEDALTWSCFEMLKSLPFEKQLAVLGEVFEDAYEGAEKPIFQNKELTSGDLEIHIGKEYIGSTTGETTELDASIELPGTLVFIEAKLYSPMSPATADKCDQIARKLRVGLDSPLNDAREFFFIFLDIAPKERLLELKRKNDTGLAPLREALDDIDAPPVEDIAANMGWLTWACLFKSLLRGMV